jgi:glycosyltransferase involved in cell wall biosynthesis
VPNPTSAPATLAIDASRTTRARITGTERYALALIRAVIAANEAGPRRPIALYFQDAPPPGLFPESACVRAHVIPFARAWTHVRLAAALAAHRPAVTWVPAHTLPFVFPGRAVVTVHDLGFRHFPNAHPPRQRAYLDLTTRTSAARAACIFADSAATAHDLGRFYGTPAERVRVLYPGVDAPSIGDRAAVRARCGLPARYFLFIGTLQPRKNIARLIAAYTRARAVLGDDAPDLVLAGGKGWLYDPAWAEGVPGVHVPGYIDEADKGALLAEAVAFVFPSLYEGFGFPVLEAMACGTPVLCSTTSSLPELAGDAALLADPTDEAAIADGLIRLARDAALRAVLSARGRTRPGLFTWEAAGERALAHLSAVADGRPLPAEPRS